MAKRKAKPRRKKSDRTKVIDKIDTYFSRYIRISWSNGDGKGKCYTCGDEKHWKQLQAGHFMSRGKMATRWHENNVRPQCVVCNVFKSGEQYQFGENLKEELGSDAVDEIVRLSNSIAKFSIADLRELEEYWKDMYNKLNN